MPRYKPTNFMLTSCQSTLGPLRYGRSLGRVQTALRSGADSIQSLQKRAEVNIAVLFPMLTGFDQISADGMSGSRCRLPTRFSRSTRALPSRSGTSRPAAAREPSDMRSPLGEQLSRSLTRTTSYRKDGKSVRFIDIRGLTATIIPPPLPYLLRSRLPAEQTLHHQIKMPKNLSVWRNYSRSMRWARFRG